MEPIKLAHDTITLEDRQELAAWILQEPAPQLTKGPLTIEFEEKFAEFLGMKHAVYVNSGSSANLLALYALVASKKLKNDIVVVPALSWVTDVSPIMQLGLRPILCDCNMDNLCVDFNKLEKIFETYHPACLMFVSVLGMMPNMTVLKNLCEEYGVLLIIDNCEGIGSGYDKKQLEQYGLMNTCSFYYGHHMSTIEGGMITTNDTDLYCILKMLRSHGWDRDLPVADQMFLRKVNNVSAFKSLYTFYYPGFNLRSTDLQAKLGLLQLEKLGKICATRCSNFAAYNRYLENPYWKPVIKNGFVSNLGYPVIHPKRDLIVNQLVLNGVEVRPLISGSMSKQPFFIEKYGNVEMKNAEWVDEYGFYLPNHPGIGEKEIKYICAIINSYM